jgi:peptidyl-prolyl cis-trans isomerase C
LEGLKKNQSSTIELGKTLDEMDLSEEIVRSETERGIAVRQLIGRRLGGDMDPSEKEIREYYDRHPEVFRVPEQIRISHILVRIEPRWQADKKEAARQRIRDIRERLRKGGDFVVLAEEVSECPSGMKGGNLGWFSRGSLTGQMETAVYSLHEGSFSDIVEDRFGFHVIKVTGRRQARTVSFSDGRGKIVEYLRQEKMRSEGEALARDLRGRAKVEVFVAEGD